MPDVRETGKIYCIEDAHTRSNTIYNVHDEDINIMSVAVGRHSQGYQCYGFFKFAPHGVPDNAIIVSATFGGRVYQRLLAGNFDLTARPCSGPWTDTEITYKTMPTSAGVSDVIGMADAGDPVESDITAIVQAWFRGDFAYENGLYITSSAASSYKRVYSCTAADANKPYINIVYYVPASKPTTDKTGIEIAAGTTVNITTNRLSDEYTHTLTWALGSETGAIAENVTATHAWTLTDADVSALLAALPAAESGTLKIVCETSDAAGKPLGTESAALTATVPATVRPTISGINITGLDLGKGNVYLSGISRMKVDVTATPGAGSTIRSVIVTVDGKKYSGASITTVPLSSGTVGADVTITDARGRTASGGSVSAVPVYAYAAPKLSAFAIERCSEDGSAVQIDGEYLRFTLDASASLIAMPSANQVTAEIYTKLRSASKWTLAGSYNNQTNVLKLENAVLPGTYSPLSSYDILLRLTDSMGTSADRLTVITTATSLQHYDPYHTRVTFGRIGESTDPEHALITALDLIAEAGVSLHGADVADGQIDLPDGGLIAASAGFELTQDDTGAIRTLESVTVTVTGKNLMGAWELGSISSSTGAEADASTTIRSGYVAVTPGVTYAISRTVAGGSFAVRGYGADKKFLGGGDVSITLVRGASTTNPIGANDYTAVFTVNAGVHYLRFLNYNTSDLTSLFQMEIGTENTEYEPYRGQVLSCDFGAPVPAAEVDFAAGIWRETWGYIASYAGETVPAGWISSTGTLNTGAQVAYPLAAPIEHAVVPQLIAAPAGPCTITTNADTLTAHAAGGRIFYTIARALNALGRT